MCVSVSLFCCVWVPSAMYVICMELSVLYERVSRIEDVWNEERENNER